MQRSRFGRNSRSAILFLLAGIISVGATVGGGWLYLRPEPAPAKKAEPPPKPLPVVLGAANDLDIGRLITASDVVWMPVQNGTVLSTHMLKGKTPEAQVIGSVVRRTVFKGRPLSWSAIVRPGEHGFLAAALKPDHRAVTIPVDGATSEAALIYPGDHVDVILTADLRDPATRETNTVTATILEYVRVVAVDRQVESSANSAEGGLLSRGSRSRNAANTVTLELPPADAERLILAKTKGTISLAMRSLTDFRRREDRTPTAFESLLPQQKPPPEPELPTGPVATTAAPVPAMAPVPGATPPAFAPSPPGSSPPVAVPMEPPEIKVKVFRGDKLEDVTVTR